MEKSLLVYGLNIFKYINGTRCMRWLLSALVVINKVKFLFLSLSITLGWERLMPHRALRWHTWRMFLQNSTRHMERIMWKGGHYMPVCVSASTISHVLFVRCLQTHAHSVSSVRNETHCWITSDHYSGFRHQGSGWSHWFPEYARWWLPFSVKLYRSRSKISIFDSNCEEACIMHCNCTAPNIHDHWSANDPPVR